MIAAGVILDAAEALNAPDTFGASLVAEPASNALIADGETGLEAEASNEVIVIGEDMTNRVVPTAEAYGASYYDPVEAPEEDWLQNNQDWINQKMDEGCTILDCGPAPGRSNFPNPTSPSYQMDLDQITNRGYQNYFQIPAKGD